MGLTLHQHSEHEGVTYDCNQCDYMATQQIIFFSTCSVSIKESNTNVTSVTIKAFPSLLLEGAQSQNMRVLDPPVKSK